MKHALFIVAPENFRDEEFFKPLEILQNADIDCTIASRNTGVCHGKLGGKVEAEIGLNQINAEDFDAIIFIGGQGSQVFLDDPSAHLIAQKTVNNEKILAAICAAPTILARAGVLTNRNVTCFPAPELEKILTESGANITQANVEIDGKIITANGPAAAKEFGEKILELLR